MHSILAFCRWGTINIEENSWSFICTFALHNYSLCLFSHNPHSVCGNSPGKNTGVGCHVLLQGIFPTQGSNPGLHHWRRILHHLSQKGSPRILEWVASPFSRGTSWPRNWPGVSCIAGGFFTNWTTREAPTPEWSLILVFLMSSPWLDPLETPCLFMH